MSSKNIVFLLTLKILPKSVLVALLSSIRMRFSSPVSTFPSKYSQITPPHNQVFCLIVKHLPKTPALKRYCHSLNRERGEIGV